MICDYILHFPEPRVLSDECEGDIVAVVKDFWRAVAKERNGADIRLCARHFHEWNAEGRARHWPAVKLEGAR